MDRLIHIRSDRLWNGHTTHSVHVGTLSITCTSLEAAMRVHAQLEAILASDDVIGASLDDQETA